jgi:hypothetical protein
MGPVNSTLNFGAWDQNYFCVLVVEERDRELCGLQ